jgi:putative ABC transport system ATP-binding protein
VTALRIRDLTVEYSSGGYAVRPIESLDADFASGELVLLLGASGCGKTTLLSALAAILSPTRGSIVVDGSEVVGLRGPALTEYRRHTVGVVFQAFNLIPSLSASENVQAPMRLAAVPARQARQRAEALLREVGLEDRTTHRPSDLSGGQQQRVAIARALANDPPLLLADVPTAHLDYIQVEGVLRLLSQLARPGRLVVVSTHDERIVPLAGRILDMSPRAPERSAPPDHRVLEPGETLFRQGDRGELIYIVEEGDMELVRQRASGGEEVVNQVGPGGYFGELAPLFGLQRSATARAQTHCRLTGYTVRDFRERMSPDRLSGLLGSDAQRVGS